MFFNDDDRATYLSLLNSTMWRYEVEILAYCLMLNHVHHLLVPHDKTGLSKALQSIHQKYARYINSQYGWAGHLWQERFYSSAVSKSETRTVLRYILRNPVEAKVVENCTDYPWSSASIHAEQRSNDFLSIPNWWQRQLDRVSDWEKWLSISNSRKQTANIRLRTLQELPIGSESFILRLERELGMDLSSRTTGRPRKK